MNSKYSHNFRLYQKMWSNRSISPQRSLDGEDIALIDEVCIRADLSESLEEYVRVLCDGMIKLLESGKYQKQLESHSVLYQKLMQLGDDIIEKSYKDSDQFYVGLFVALRVKYDWLKSKFYRLVKGMLHHVLDLGLKINQGLREKIINHLKSQDPEFFNALIGNKLRCGRGT